MATTASSCPSCGRSVRDGDIHCATCGHKLTVSVTTHRPIPYGLILAIIWLVIASSAALALLFALRHVVFQIVVAAFLALVVTPAVTWLQRRGLRRGMAITVLVAGLTVGTLGIAAAVAVPLTTEATRFAANAPQYLDEIEKGDTPIAHLARKFGLQKRLEDSGNSLSGTLSKVSDKLVEFGRKIAEAAFEAIIIVIMAIFMLVEGPKMIAAFLRLIPDEHEDAARRVGHGMLKVVSGYTTGVLFMAALNGIVAGIALEGTRTKFAIPLAIWAGVVDILPIVGGLLSIVPAAVFALGHSYLAAGIVIGSMFAYQQVKNHYLYPVIVGRAVDLNSLLVLLAVLAGASLGHVAGAVLAIPVAGTIQVVGVEVVRWRRENGSTADETVTVAVDEQPDEEATGKAARALARVRDRVKRRKDS